jgi:hypothetical protein
MSGIPECNYPAFEAASLALRQMGFDVLSPHETLVNREGAIPWDACLRHDIRTLSTCDGIILLPGWSASKGARLEMFIAKTLGMPIKLFIDGELTDVPPT